jgi:hypothetical protein
MPRGPEGEKRHANTVDNAAVEADQATKLRGTYKKRDNEIQISN